MKVLRTDEVVTLLEAEKLTGISPVLLGYHIRSRRIPCNLLFNKYLISRKALDRFMEAYKAGKLRKKRSDAGVPRVKKATN